MLYSAFADVLDYPGVDFPRRVARCLERLPARADQARELVAAFSEEAARLGGDRLEEAYAAAFDLDADSTLDVGHHLFGHDPRRSLFLSRLVAEYLESGFRPSDTESPDHLPAILRYLDSGITPESRADLIEEAVRPAALRIAQALERRAHVYAPLLHALTLVLQPAPAPPAAKERATA